jgi:hypothetical protein
LIVPVSPQAKANSGWTAIAPLPPTLEGLRLSSGVAKYWIAYAKSSLATNTVGAFHKEL